MEGIYGSAAWVKIEQHVIRTASNGHVRTTVLLYNARLIGGPHLSAAPHVLVTLEELTN